MKNHEWNIRGSFLMLIETVICILIAVFITYQLLNVFYKPSPRNTMLKEEGINTSSQKALIDSTREKAEKASRQIEERNKQLQDAGLGQ